MRIQILMMGVMMGGAMLALSACESTKETIGLNKRVPDEFKVVKRAPLATPPNYVLRPPTPGAPRPQEQTTAQEAADTVFGNDTNSANTAPSSVTTYSVSESIFLDHAGANDAQDDIRRVVDAETLSLGDRNESVAAKILHIGGDSELSASVVDAQAEAQRIQDNQAAGAPITDGETPSIEE